MKKNFFKKGSASGAVGFTGTTGQKAPGGGATVTAEQLAMINKYALTPLAADDVYVRKFLIAHNMVDRDRERFSEKLLDDFAETFPGKSYLFAHDRYEYLPMGLIFSANTETMSPEAFTALTGEPAKLPAGVEQCKVVWAWYYTPRGAGYDDLIKNTEAGIYRHGSIGFAAADLAPVKGEFDQILYYEYKSPGEAREASLVWLGAQPGATTQKGADASGEGDLPEPDNKNNHQGDSVMKLFKSLLGGLLGKTFNDDTSEQSLFDSVKAVVADKDAQITTLEGEKAALAPLAEDGKSFRKHLVDEYVRMKTALGECKEDVEAGKTLGQYVETLPIPFLQSEVKALTDRMDAKFPDTGQLSGDKGGNRTDGTAGVDDNPLIPKD